jgi:ubiquinone/menaquinone biosynthesis C-methylase UbiE
MTNDPEGVQQRITAFWSATAAQYDAHPGNIAAPGSDEYRAWVDAFRDALPAPPADILDLGTGTGFAALIAAGLGHRVTGVDLSEAMLEQAREKAREGGLDVSFALGDAVQPRFPPESFDVVMSRHLLWTLREPEIAFVNWRRLLRPGGHLIATHAFWSWDEDAGGGEHGDDIFSRHYTTATRAALPVMALGSLEPLIEMLERAGFGETSAQRLDEVHSASQTGDEPVPYLLKAYCG